MAQKRFTAVGRVAAMYVQISSNFGQNSSNEPAVIWRAPSARPMAAETPIAGAPRTQSSLMPFATVW